MKIPSPTDNPVNAVRKGLAMTVCPISIHNSLEKNHEASGLTAMRRGFDHFAAVSVFNDADRPSVELCGRTVPQCLLHVRHT